MTTKQFVSKVEKQNSKSPGTVVLEPPLTEAEHKQWAAKHPHTALPKDLVAFLKQHNGLCVQPNANSPDGIFRLLSLGQIMDRQGVLEEGITFVIEDLPEGGLVISKDSDGESYLILQPADGTYVFLDAGQYESVGGSLAEMLSWLHDRFVSNKDRLPIQMFWRVTAEGQAQVFSGSEGEIRCMRKWEGYFYSAEWGRPVVGGEVIHHVLIRRHGPMALDSTCVVVLEPPYLEDRVAMPIVDFAMLPKQYLFLLEDAEGTCHSWSAMVPTAKPNPMAGAHYVPPAAQFCEVRCFEQSRSQGKQHWMTTVGPRAYFVVYPPSGEKELWTSDGTADGTRNLRSWKRHGPAFLLEHQGELIFAAGEEK